MFTNRGRDLQHVKAMNDSLEFRKLILRLQSSELWLQICLFAFPQETAVCQQMKRPFITLVNEGQGTGCVITLINCCVVAESDVFWRYAIVTRKSKLIFLQCLIPFPGFFPFREVICSRETVFSNPISNNVTLSGYLTPTIWVDESRCQRGAERDVRWVMPTWTVVLVCMSHWSFDFQGKSLPGDD